MKMRKLPLMLSLPGSPRPVVGTGFWKLSDQPLKVPVPVGRRGVLDDERPGSLGVQAREGG